MAVGCNESDVAQGKAQALFSKVERAFFEGVNVTNHQDGNETEHAPEDRAALLDRVSVNDRPGIHKYDFEVEEDEEHGHDIKLYAEPRMPFALRHHSAFIGGVFRSRAFPACLPGY